MGNRAPNLRVVAVSLDCADHGELAQFYARLLGGTVLWNTQTAAAVQAGGYVLVAQHVTGYRPPEWPGTPIVHLDLNGDLDVAELQAHAVDCGARLAQTQPDSRWVVLLDPAGHPFCITPFSPFRS
jgi:catechol-2,3-dioxygenase